MSWEVILGLYVAGTIGTGIVLYLAVHLGIRWQKELPKKPIHESLTVLQQRLEERQAEFEELQEEMFQAHGIISEAKKERAWLDANEEHIQGLRRKAEELREVEDKLAGAIDERDKVLGEMRDLEVKRAGLEAKLQGEEDILARIDELRQERAALQANVQSANRELEGLLGRIEEAESRLGELTQLVRDAEKRVEAIRGERGQLLAEVAQLGSERDHLQRQIENLTKERIAVAPPEAASVEERTAAIWSPRVIPPMSKPCLVRSPRSERSRGALGRIRDSGLIFHDRSVCAFHTGLKVARETPLLVLAGISGTGKSALPRRYAEMMGMHFHNVAVQPGWDSPMDLVGFYNHLEGRFKPTELTRALVQMETIGAKSGRRWPESSSKRSDLSDQMLVVLLDEMNLARVEYYFSDFLSRLEIRRDIDPGSERQRRASEIQLEIGRGEDQSGQSVPLFVAENVLFVGTMNEDESTQALSDKVIDRSNVMRFGRPSTLVQGGGTPVSPEPASLSFETWKRWREQTDPLSEPEEERVNRWIEQCNELLDTVGRPFAHRTAQTMREYVKQYPRVVSNRLETAMADQLEMQVLPRLRGIDTDDPRAREALDKTGSLAAELEDSKLAEAVARAIDRSGDQFIWSGVDRPLDEVVGTPAAR